MTNSHSPRPPAACALTGSVHLSPKCKRSRMGPFEVLDRVFGSLDRACPDDFPGRLGLEGHGLAGEGIGALARLGGGLLDHHELGESGNEEHTRLLELLVTDGR